MTAINPGLPEVPPFPKMHGVGGLILAFVFAVFYAYDVWAAVAALLRFISTFEEFGISSAAPVWLYIAGVALPILIFVLAFLTSRRRRLYEQAVIYLLGLAVTAALSAGIAALGYAIFTGSLAAL
jgi:hypothetical protein